MVVNKLTAYLQAAEEYIKELELQLWYKPDNIFVKPRELDRRKSENYLAAKKEYERSIGKK